VQTGGGMAIELTLMLRFKMRQKDPYPITRVFSNQEQKPSTHSRTSASPLWPTKHSDSKSVDKNYYISVRTAHRPDGAFLIRFQSRL